MSTIQMTPPERKRQTCTIHIDAGLIARIPVLIAEIGTFDSIALLYDVGIERIAKDIAKQLPSACLLPVESGDGSKSLLKVESLAEQMIDAGCGRSTLLVNVGGGMITDLGGLLASIFMRGIACVHIPTSLLGMVDAAVGGKTGVNVGHRKNVLGTISHPRAVIIDTDFLESLPLAQLQEGLVEVVKIAAMRSDVFFSWLEKNMEDVLQRKPEALHQCIADAVALKVRTVEEDEVDLNARLQLNFGHTVGHAVEALSHFALSHGKAVSIGMSIEMQIATFAQSDRVEALLKELSMPLSVPQEFTLDRLWKLMQSDKKNVAGSVRIAVPQRIGVGTVRPVTFEEFSAVVSRS